VGFEKMGVDFMHEISGAQAVVETLREEHMKYALSKKLRADFDG